MAVTLAHTHTVVLSCTMLEDIFGGIEQACMQEIDNIYGYIE